jgi:HEPN domain-containing protein
VWHCMSAERVIANTVRLAQADLDAAKLLHAGKNRYAIYHCEQAAEKVIKAVLTSEGRSRQHQALAR